MKRFAHLGQRGFTLIEIMVVVVILAILASFVVPNIMSAPGEARITKAHHDIRAIENALERYKLDNYRYPTTEQGLQALVTAPTAPPVPENWSSGGYLKDLPEDPWERPYQYLGAQDTGGRPQIFTLGADHRPGGEDQDADISNVSNADAATVP